MTVVWNDLLSCLELRAHTSAFEGGDNLPLPYHRLFGGQLLAQFVRAASLTCPGKSVKSLNVLFAREGLTDEPVRYEVSVHHEGRTFATLTITGRQTSGVVASAAVSLHAAEDGPDHQIAFPAIAVPGPEQEIRLDLIPWELRAATELDTPKAEAPEYELWMRTPEADPELAPALTAYATDLSLIGTALRPVEGISQHDARTAFTSAVTSHSVWFHRPFRTDEWLLLRQHSPILAHGRCFGRGDVLTEDGSLVASYAQEALLRFR